MPIQCQRLDDALFALSDGPPLNSMCHSWSVSIPVAVNWRFGETVSSFYTWTGH